MTEVVKIKLMLPKWISSAKRRSLSTPCGKAVFALALIVASTLGALGQTPTPSPNTQDLQVPSIAPDYTPEDRPLPELGRVGVDMGRQRPLTLREALTLALENNKDIEVARHNVKIAEFDLTTARGAYDPRFVSSAYYERIENPISSFFERRQRLCEPGKLHRDCPPRRTRS